MSNTLVNNTLTSGFIINQAGILSTLQDSGRFGAFNLGLTNGGPVDYHAFYWANRLCGNNFSQQEDFTSIEITLGGFEFTSQVTTLIAITGANIEFFINGKLKQLWRSYLIQAGDVITLGYPTNGIRNYIAVKDGFTISPIFGSTSTVCRESIGGLNGGKLIKDDLLPCSSITTKTTAGRSESYDCLSLDKTHWPTYQSTVTLRTVAGYQHQEFTAVQQQLFYSSEYEVSSASDRMGYRLQGQKISTKPKDMLSEGICHGAIQIPADGQPIVLLNDRQTIGGYPKIGAVIAADTAKLAQVSQGAKVRFKQVSIEDAHNIFHLALAHQSNIQLTTLR